MIKGLETLFVIGALALIGIFPVAFALSQTMFINLHLIDALFLAEIGWRMFHGAVPGIDFGGFFGGISGWFVALAYGLFGVELKALDYAFLMQLGVSLVVLGLVAYRRLNLTLFAALALMTTAIILSRSPMEETPTIVRFVSALSFSYNRFAMALMIAVAIFVIVEVKSRRLELLIGILVGLCLTVILLTKTSFFPFPIMALAAIAVQGRWRALGGAILGAGALMAAMDPAAERVIGTLEYATAMNGIDPGEIGWVFYKAIWMVLGQLWAFLAAGLAILLCLLLGRGALRKAALAAIVISFGMMASATTMGPAGLPGFHSVPLLAVLIVGVYAVGVAEGEGFTGYLYALATVLVLAPTGGQLATTAVALAKAERNAARAQFQEGGLAGLWVEDGGLTRPDGERFAGPADRDALINAAAVKLASGAPSDIDIRFAQVVEAVTVLSTYPDIQTRQVVTDTRLNLGMALGARPVLTYPIWPRPWAPEFLAMEALPEEIDLVLLAKPGPAIVNEVLVGLMGEDYVVCEELTLWTVYVRGSVGVAACAGG